MTGSPRWPGAVVFAIVLVICLGPLGALALRAEGRGALLPGDWAAIRFTLTQALMSAFLSVILAIPVARALARRQFMGRGLLITLLGAPFILPVIVAVLGLLAIFGQKGLFNQMLGLVGLPEMGIYGFHGVVLAHVFLNLPLATRLILQGWLSIPAERFKLAASLGVPVGRLLEWPMLRSVLPGAFATIFLVCLTSFAVALTLGGGPRATTIELAIYQAMRFDFDPGKSALLALIQFAICGVVVVVAWKIALPDGFAGGLDRTVQRWDDGRWILTADRAATGAAAVFLVVPLLAVVVRGLPGLAEMPPDVWPAALRSVLVALASVVLCLTMALGLALRGGALTSMAGLIPLATSPLVMGTGLFLMLFANVDPGQIALPLTALVNALLSLPFALRVIEPAVARSEAAYGRIATSLGLVGWARVRLLVLPRIRQPLGFAAGLTAALSMGDLGLIALIGQNDQVTLPLVMQRLMGAYRLDAAAGAALLLIFLSLSLFWLFDRGGRGDADA
jgi:thiamine transport system permease protein